MSEELMAKISLNEMGARYCDACDAMDWDAALELFTEDAEVDAALAALLAAELINERAIYPVAEYSFKHPLTHEVSLHAQLTTARRAR